MNGEISALMKNKPLRLDLSPGRRVIECKWVFKLKKDPYGIILRHKAKLIAQGSNQIPAFDYS